jgi:hypothetical protein
MNSLQFRNDSKHWNGPPATVSRQQIDNPDPPVYSFTAIRATRTDAVITFEAKTKIKWAAVGASCACPGGLFCARKKNKYRNFLKGGLT